MPQLQKIGTMESRVVGRGYYHADVENGQEVFLERNPENEFDHNAVEVHDAGAHVLGHLPRRDAAFLGPLIDAGVIHLKGVAAGDDGASVPLGLDVYAATNGKKLLDKAAADSPDDVLRSFLASLLTSKRYGPDTLRELSQRLDSLAHEDAAGELRLLHRMILSRARALEDLFDARTIVAQAISEVVIGDLLQWDRLTLAPLLTPSGTAGFEGLLLQEAIESGVLQVEEVSESGSVPTVAAHNRSSKPVLVLAGDLLSGAKQDRVVNFSVLLPAGKRTELDVSCVEQGRWSRRSRTFQPAGRAHATLRRTVYETAAADDAAKPSRRSDQSRVWEEVAGVNARLGMQSETDTLQDGIAAAKRRLESARESLPCPDNAVGFVAFIDGALSCVELLPGARHAAALWPHLVEGLALEATLAQQPSDARDDVRRTQDILRSVAGSLGPDRPGAALGREVVIAGDYPGMALVQRDALLHLSAFATP